MTTSRPADEIGVVIHGPEVIDSGFAIEALDWLEKSGRTVAVLGGTMGRLAAIDAGLDDRIDISSRRTPSQSVRMLSSSSAVVLLNHAKSLESGLAFGFAVAANARTICPLIQVDSGGGFVVQLSGCHPLAQEMSRRFGLELLLAPGQPPPLLYKDGLVVRRLSCVLPGEKISINGTVIATATSDSVEILAGDGQIIDIRGARIKQHGLEKLPHIDIEEAIIRSGTIRRTSATCLGRTRSGYNLQGGREKMRPPGSTPGGYDAGKPMRVAIIDHVAEATFETASGASAAITIGDDTTAIAGDILSRLGIPVIGIVDGDRDEISAGTCLAAGSIIIRVASGSDDIVGRKAGKIPVDGVCSLEELAGLLISIAGDDLISVQRTALRDNQSA